MLKQTNAATSGVILVWYLVGAASGWKGWVPVVVSPAGTHATGTTSGGHGSVFSGGWGGGK